MSFQLLRMVSLKKVSVFCVHLFIHTFDKLAFGANYVAGPVSRG